MEFTRLLGKESSRTRKGRTNNGCKDQREGIVSIGWRRRNGLDTAAEMKQQSGNQIDVYKNHE